VLSAYQYTNRGQTDVLAAKFRPAGALVYSTYLGGSGADSGKSIALDAAGNAYLAGNTFSSDFPAVAAFQPASGGNQDAFVAKLSAAGNSLIYRTYLGGSGGTFNQPESGMGIAVDASGNVYVAGVTSSTNFPLANAMQSVHTGSSTDAFVAKLNAGGTGLVYSTYLGGSSIDWANAIAVDSSGSAYLTGASTDFPLAQALQASNAGGYDVFLTQLAPDGSLLLRSTYLGGGSNDVANVLVIDLSEAVVLGGQTTSGDFPVKGGVQRLNRRAFDAFVARIIPDPVYQGYFDGCDCGNLAGWAWNRSDPYTAASVDIYDGATLLATVPATAFRPDLLTAGMGDGNHGLIYSVPLSLKDGQHHTVHLKHSATGGALGNSPFSLTCALPAPTVYIDSPVPNSLVSGAVVISGWAVNSTPPLEPQSAKWKYSWTASRQVTRLTVPTAPTSVRCFPEERDASMSGGFFSWIPLLLPSVPI
jgi:hypothetical protein